MQTVIALDQGSSSSRALAFDERGRVVARAQFPVKTRFPRPGYVEHDALDLAATTERALDAVLGKLPKKAEVLGLGIACQRSTIVLWDARTGRPACPAPSWQDARAAEIAASMRDKMQAVHEKTGLYLMPYYSAPKLRHLLDHEPAARALADSGHLRAAPVSTFLLWRLTKGELFGADPSMAQRTLLFNIQNGDWDDELLSWFSIPRACLPGIIGTSGRLGTILRKGRKIPVLATVGDQPSAAYGQGAAEGSGVLNYGTGAFFLLNTGAKLHRVPGLLTSAAWKKSGEPCAFFLEGTVHAAGTSFEWLKKNLGLLKDVRGVDAECRRSTQRVLALQAIGGLGAPRWDFQTPTVFFGLDARTRKEDLVRAVAESIAFQIADIVSAVRAAGLEPGVLKASGGLARVDALLQFQADLLQRPIARIEESEATALGAALLAAEAAGATWAASLRTEGDEREFAPAMAADDARKLLDGWRVFVSAQQKLAGDLRALGFGRA